LNTQLLKIHAQLLRSSPSEAVMWRSQAAPVIEQRSAALSALAGEDPSQALSLAFSPGLLAELAAAFPQSAGRLESRGVWTGPIEYVVIDEVNLAEHRSIRWMKVGGEVLEIDFAGREPPDLQSGDILTVSGVRFGNRVAAAGGKKSGGSAAPASACSTTGVQKIAVLLVTFPGVTPPLTPQAAFDIFFGATDRSLDGYWQEASYNQASASGTVFGWYTLNTSYTCDQYWQLRDAVIAAADPDVNFNNYTRIFIVFPKPSGCSYGGLGTIAAARSVQPMDPSRLRLPG
jgi:hypothetical protein